MPSPPMNSSRAELEAIRTRLSALRAQLRATLDPRERRALRRQITDLIILEIAAHLAAVDEARPPQGPPARSRPRRGSHDLTPG